MNKLLNDNYVFIYLLTLIMFLKPEKLEDNQKIYMAYLITFFIDLVNTLPTLWILFISILVLFLYVEYFENSSFKRDVMTKIHHKVIDFLYVMIFQYCLIRYICLLFLNTNFIMEYIQNIFGAYSLNILFIARLILFGWLTNSMFSLPWKIKKFDEIQREMETISKIYDLSDEINEEKFHIVILLEDKSYYQRESLGTAFSWGYLKDYAFAKLCENFKHKNESKLNKKKNKILRGYSTIEAQLIRSIGIEKGYNDNFFNIVKRKLFELIYTELVFSNLAKYYKKNEYFEDRKKMKDYLLYIYLHKARVQVKDRKCIGLKELFGVSNIEDLDECQLFIGVLSFSKYDCQLDEIKNYALSTYNLQLDPKNIEKAYESIKTNKKKLKKNLIKDLIVFNILWCDK